MPLGADEPLAGCVLAGTVRPLLRRWFVAVAGALSATAMHAVYEAFKDVLALR